MLVAEQRSTLLAVVCIAVLVVVAFWAALSGNNYTSLPPPITTTIPQPCQAGASDCGSTYNSYTGPIVTVDRIVRAHSGEIEAVSTALLTIITAGLVYIARAQYVTTRAQLRAYVFVKEGSITRKVNNIGQVVFSAHLNVRNFGLTPAYNFTTEHDIAILAAGNKDFTDLHNRSDRKSTIGPGAEVNCVPETDPISNQEEADISNERKRIFVWGRFDYLDAFGSDRFLKFYFVAWKQIEPNRWSIQPCGAQEGN